MSSAEQNFRFYKFGEFTLDVRRRILLKNGEQLAIPTKHYDLLLVLVENDGRIVTHDELLDKVWEGTFVEQSNLKKGISALRQIFGETPNSSLFIRTIPRRGYSFVAPVEKLSDEPETFFFSSSQIIIEEEIIEDESSSALETQKLLSAKSSNFLVKNKTLILTCLLLLLGGAIYFASRRFSRPASINFSIEKVRLKKLTNEGKLGNSVAISPDGNYIAYPVYDGQIGTLKLKQVATGSITILRQPESVSYWAYNFSPDGNYVYYIVNYQATPTKSGLYRMPSLGGTPQKLQDLANGNLTFSPDGSRLAYKRRSADGSSEEVVTSKPDGTDLKRIFTLPENKYLSAMVWSPDGNTVLCAFREFVSEKPFSYVAEVSLEGNGEQASEKEIIPPQENPITFAVWLPDKSSMIVHIRETNADVCQIWQYFPSTGEKKRITNDNFTYRASQMTKDGKTLVTSQENAHSQLFVGDTEKYDFKPVSNQTLPVSSALWTLQNQITCLISENYEESLWIMNEDGSEIRKITDGRDGIGLLQSISNDGNFITYSSSRGGIDQIWRIGLDGRNLTQIAQKSKMGMYSSKLLSDGKTLLFLGYLKTKGSRLYKQTADGQLSQLTEADTSDWEISNDEKLLFYQAEDQKTRKFLISVKNLETGELLKTFDFDSDLTHWSSDGKGLVYLKISHGINEVMVQPLEGDKPRTLFSLPGDPVFSFDFSRDGKKIALTRGRLANDAILINAEN